MKKEKILILIFIFITFFSFKGFCQSQPVPEVGKPYKTIKLVPSSQLFMDKGLQRFINVLHSEVRAKNWNFLKGVLVEKIFDKGSIQQFAQEWKLDQYPESSPLWGELYLTIHLGGFFNQNDHYVTPYASDLPANELKKFFKESNGIEIDPVDYIAIVGKSVNVRKGSGLKYPVIDQLNYDIVKELPWEDKTKSYESVYGFSFPWVKIMCPSGKVGYVYGQYTYHFLSNYTATFKKVNGNWLLAGFYNG